MNLKICGSCIPCFYVLSSFVCLKTAGFLNKLLLNYQFQEKVIFTYENNFYKEM